MDNESKPYKILIVDDNRQNIEILMNLLGDDYKVIAALNGERTLKIAASDSPPDLILLDILMPDMDGYQVCTRLKESETTRNIPVMFVTAVSEAMDETRGFALGAVDYITKPFHPPMVKARVKLQLNLKRKRDLLEQLAFMDGLTEIPNRRRFDETLEAEWNRALRSGNPLSLLLMDVDHFKLYNDTHGHGSGDECLRLVAGAIQNSLRRAGDFVGRYGGEEFAVILPYADEDEAMTVARIIQEKVDRLALPHDASPVAPHVTLSIGVTTLHPDHDQDHGMELADFVKLSDKAMYAAKNAGRHRIRRS